MNKTSFLYFVLGVIVATLCGIWSYEHFVHPAIKEASQRKAECEKTLQPNFECALEYVPVSVIRDSAK